MAQQAIEMILARHLASYLAMPIFLVDPRGVLLFYNDPAGRILGRQFDETGAMPLEEWSDIFAPTDQAGQPIPPQLLPLTTTLAQQRTAHADFWIRGLDEVARHIEVTAIPLIGQAGHFLGAMAVFSEVGR